MAATKTAGVHLTAIRRARRAVGTVERIMLKLERTETRLAAAEARIKKQDDTIYYLAKLMKMEKKWAAAARKEAKVLRQKLEAAEAVEGSGDSRENETGAEDERT